MNCLINNKIFFMKIILALFFLFSFTSKSSVADFKELKNNLTSIENIETNLEKIIKTNFTYGAIKIKNHEASKKLGYNYGFFILGKNKKNNFYLNFEGYFTFVNIKKKIYEGRTEGRDVIKELGKMSLKSKFETTKLCRMSFSQKKKQSFNKYNKSIIKIFCSNDFEYLGKIKKSKSVHNIFGVMADWSVHGYKLDSAGEFKKGANTHVSTLMIVLSDDVNKGVANVIPNYLKGYVINEKMTISKKLLSHNKGKEIVVKEDLESKKLAEQKSKELEQEKARRIAEEKERKILEAKTKQLAEEKRLAELKAKKRTEEIAKEVAAENQKKIQEERALRKAEELKRKKAEERAKKIALEKKLAEEKAKKEAKKRALKLAEERKKTEEVAKRLEQERLKAELKTKKLEKAQQIQLAALEKEKAEKQKLILKEKKKTDELEKKLAALEEENKANRSKGNKVYKAKLPSEWMPFQNKMSIQQEQFCQLTDRFFKDMDKAIASRNDIRVNMVHQERQENLDALIPSGKISNWIFKVIKIEQVEDGSAAVVLSLQCKSFVGSGQVHTKSSWRKKSNKEWRATIPRDDRRFRELAKLGLNDFILGSGTLLEVSAFKPGQIETFYASQQIGEHPLTKDLNLEGELFLADLSYIAALN